MDETRLKRKRKEENIKDNFLSPYRLFIKTRKMTAGGSMRPAQESLPLWLQKTHTHTQIITKIQTLAGEPFRSSTPKLGNFPLATEWVGEFDDSLEFSRDPLAWT